MLAAAKSIDDLMTIRFPQHLESSTAPNRNNL